MGNSDTQPLSGWVRVQHDRRSIYRGRIGYLVGPSRVLAGATVVSICLYDDGRIVPAWALVLEPYTPTPEEEAWWLIHQLSR